MLERMQLQLVLSGMMVQLILEIKLLLLGFLLLMEIMLVQPLLGMKPVQLLELILVMRKLGIPFQLMLSMMKGISDRAQLILLVKLMMLEIQVILQLWWCCLD